MSAEVLGSVQVPAPAAKPSLGPRRVVSPAVLEPALVNRLLAVASAIFAAPALVALYALAAGAVGPSLSAASGMLLAATVLSAGFGWMLLTAPRIPELRTARLLCAVLAVEACVLAVRVAAQLFA